MFISSMVDGKGVSVGVSEIENVDLNQVNA